jgi:hypothetical protein
LESGEESWGFRPRPATLGEQFSGNAEMALRMWGPLLFFAASGLIAGAFAVWGRMSLRKGWLYALVIALVRILAISVVLLPSMFFAAIGAITGELWIASIVAGAAPVVLLTCARRQWRALPQ